ncbi:MAG TPA: Gfo/Idh/MocA family oxidoreductase, partial [Thermoanaerobaculia bacterium]|nr:Gfo/Idh/MocA family oxidoreductase [Thermoanaerobaculia bacterium]
MTVSETVSGVARTTLQERPVHKERSHDAERPAERTTRRPLRPGEPARVAVVGAGYVANFHLEILAEMPDVQVVAVCDPALDRAREAAAKFHIPNAVASVDELPALGVEVAHVLVPPDLHVTVTRRLLELGIGALVEKPLALSSADGRELQRLAGERGLPLGVNHNNVHHPAFSRLLKHVRMGRIGRLEHVQICFNMPLAQLEAGDFSHWMFRAPRNIVFEQAPHPLSQLHALIGRVLSARTTLLGTRELLPGQVFHDRWLVAARGERGTAEIYLAFGQPFQRWTIQVLGTDGSAEADLGNNFFSYEEKTPWLEFWNTFLAGTRRARSLAGDATANLGRYAGYTLGMTRRQDYYFVGMRRSVRAFYAALRAGRDIPGDAGQGAEVLEWCEAVAEVAATPAASSQPALLPEPGPARPGEVVVLGGNGFIGRRVVSKLLERGLPVSVVVRRAHSLPPEISEPARAG